MRTDRLLVSASLRTLLVRIVADMDRAALAEQLRRAIFDVRGVSGLTFVAACLRLEACARSDWPQVAVESASQRLTDLFTSFPHEDGGLDCRNTYRAALRICPQPERDSLEDDHRLALVLSALASRQYHKGLCEAQRTGSRTRYTYRVNGHAIPLLMPITLAGEARADWIAREVGSVDPSAPGERERIQAVINERLGNGFSDLDDMIADTAATMPWIVADRIDEVGLGAAVADEKAKSIDQLPEPIAALGENSVRKLVRESFDAMDGTPSAARIAAKFGLSPATYSRFAGRRWVGTNNVPALWRNLAGVLAASERFAAVCERAGVWQVVRQVALQT